MEHIVQSCVSERGLHGHQAVGGLLAFLRLGLRGLGVTIQSIVHIIAYLLKMFLGFLDFLHITEKLQIMYVIEYIHK